MLGLLASYESLQSSWTSRIYIRYQAVVLCWISTMNNATLLYEPTNELIRRVYGERLE